jgi:hypothetical protein
MGSQVRVPPKALILLKMKIKQILMKWSLAIKIIPLLIGVVVLKLIFHKLGWEVLELNALFTSIIAATTFLLGFLITGVISDYKESEKIPGELASSLEVLHDETSIIYKNKKDKTAKEFLDFQLKFLDSLNQWFYKKEKTTVIMDKITKMNDYFLTFESLTQAAFISRMKQEQNNIRKLITRVHTIRETSFVGSAYAIVEALAFFLITGLIFLKVEPFYGSLFFVVLVSFMVLYMIFLIRDLDDPFEYKEHGESGSEVSLKPIHDLEKRLKERSID